MNAIAEIFVRFAPVKGGRLGILRENLDSENLASDDNHPQLQSFVHPLLEQMSGCPTPLKQAEMLCRYLASAQFLKW